MLLSEKLRVPSGRKIKLADHDPDGTPGYRDKRAAKKIFKKNRTRLAELQYTLYAENKRAVLVVLQALDAGGKDGTIRSVCSRLNPQGCKVTSFKVPSSEEANHDFLWRIHRAVPPRGEIGVFNRSHYEDVLVVRVEKLVPDEVWSKRYEQINAFEKTLVENSVVILKFYLHISKAEQRRRLQGRLDMPHKHWKIRPEDFETRKLWDKYMDAYEDALSKCSMPWAPWFVIPANNKWYRDLAISEILVDSLEKLKMKFPKPVIDVSKVRLK